MEVAYNPNLFIQNSKQCPVFADKVSIALDVIKSSAVGQRLLDKLAKGKHRIDIEFNDLRPLACLPHLMNGTIEKVKGVRSTIYIPHMGFYSHKNERYDSDPFFMALANQLIQAYFYSYASHLDIKITENAFRRAFGLTSRTVQTEYDCSDSEYRAKKITNAAHEKSVHAINRLPPREPNYTDKIRRLVSLDQSNETQ